MTHDEIKDLMNFFDEKKSINKIKIIAQNLFLWLFFRQIHQLNKESIFLAISSWPCSFG